MIDRVAPMGADPPDAAPPLPDADTHLYRNFVKLRNFIVQTKSSRHDAVCRAAPDKREWVHYLKYAHTMWPIPSIVKQYSLEISVQCPKIANNLNFL